MLDNVIIFLILMFLSLKDNLVKDHAKVDGDVMMRAFQRSAKAKPLHRSDLVGFEVKFSKVDGPFYFFLLSYFSIYCNFFACAVVFLNFL